jgi:hypothetical protein
MQMKACNWVIDANVAASWFPHKAYITLNCSVRTVNHVMITEHTEPQPRWYQQESNWCPPLLIVAIRTGMSSQCFQRCAAVLCRQTRRFREYLTCCSCGLFMDLRRTTVILAAIRIYADDAAGCLWVAHVVRLFVL